MNEMILFIINIIIKLQLYIKSNFRVYFLKRLLQTTQPIIRFNIPPDDISIHFPDQSFTDTSGLPLRTVAKELVTCQISHSIFKYFALRNN
ncbi:hypothetical protein Hanom_Chr07g00654691 [Helianthus anomalus]